MKLPAPLLDIFQGHYSGKRALWITAVSGIAAARERMKQLAAEKPGAYFAYSAHDRLVVAIADTAAQLATC